MNKLQSVLKNNRLICVKTKDGEVKRIGQLDAYNLVKAGATYCSKTEYKKFIGTYKTKEEKEIEAQEKAKKVKKKKK